MFIIFRNISINRCLFKPFHLLLTNTKIINKYHITYTLCNDLNRLQVYVTEIKEKQIFERIRCQLRIFESVFYKSLIRACSFGNFLAASQNARSNGQTSNHRHCEFVKNALKKCSCLPPDAFKYLCFFYFCHIHLKSIQTTM